MGINNRDYIRDAPLDYRPAMGASGLVAVKWIIAINVLVFMLQWVSRDPQIFQHFGETAAGATGLLTLSFQHLLDFEFWRLLTYGFCHANLVHLFFNMFGLWIFGQHVEPRLGTREFVALYLLSIVISGLGHVVYQVASGSPAGTIGASGGVMAITCAAAVFSPRSKIMFMFVIPLELRYLVMFYVFMDLMGMSGGGSGVANASHLAGAATGLAAGYYQWRLTDWTKGLSAAWRRRQLRRGRSHLKIHTETPVEDVKDRVDRLLEKIHAQGESSLSTEERDFLAKASRSYRK